MNRRLLLVAVLASAMAGCKTAGVQAWRTRDSYRAAILLKADVQPLLDAGSRLLRVELVLEDQRGRKSVLDVSPGALDRYKGVVLASVLPGSYRVRPQVTLAAEHAEIVRVLEPEAMTDVGSIPARSAEVEVLGTIRITIRPPMLGDMSDSRFTVDREPDTKRAVLRQALQFEEAFYSGWKPPLEALLKGGLN